MVRFAKLTIVSNGRAVFYNCHGWNINEYHVNEAFIGTLVFFCRCCCYLACWLDSPSSLEFSLICPAPTQPNPTQPKSRPVCDNQTPAVELVGDTFEALELLLCPSSAAQFAARSNEQLY